MTIKEALKHGRARLQAHASPTATLDTECLLQFVLRMHKTQIYAHREQVLTEAQQVQLQALLVRRQRGEPIAYLIGSKEFYGRNFHVDRHVLIPRPETEALVVQAKAHLPADTSTHILDSGTGSGCLAITLALEFERSQVTAWEISPAALAVAQHNAVRLACPNVAFVHHDIFAPLPSMTTRFNLIVANPPYILPGEKTRLPASVLDYEPHTALFADRHGLSHYQRLATLAPQLLCTAGLLCVELNPATALATTAIFAAQGFETVARGYEGQGLMRTLTLRKV